MVADPLRRGNGDRAFLSCLAAFRASYVGIILLNFVSCTADVPERVHRVALREPVAPGPATDGASWPFFQRKSDTQQVPPKEAHRNERQRNGSKAHLPTATHVSISPRPRRSEKSNAQPLTQTEKEQLFQADDTKQRHPIDAGEVPHASGRASYEAEANSPRTHTRMPTSASRAGARPTRGKPDGWTPDGHVESSTAWHPATVCRSHARSARSMRHRRATFD
jgi:hypothetical protein